MADRDRRSAIADGPLIRPGGRRPVADLRRHRVLDARVVDQLRPGPPRVREGRIVRVGLRQQPMDLVEQEPFVLDRGRPPADLGPHQAQRAVEQVLAVRRVRPPRRDVGGDPRVRDRHVQPRGVARTEGGEDRALEVIADIFAEAEWDGPVHRRRSCAGIHQRAAEPCEITALRDGSIGEGGGRRVRRWIGPFLTAALPCEREVGAHPLQDPADEPVVARADGLGRGRDRNTTGVGRGHDQRRSSRVELDRQLRLALLADRPLDRPDGLGKRRLQPRLGIGQQAVGGGDPRDQAAPGRLTREPGMEWADQHRRHGSPDHTPRGPAGDHAVRTARRGPRVRTQRSNP